MKFNHWLATIASAAALGLVALPAQAAPASAGFAGTLQAAGAPAAEVQLAHWDGRGYYYRRHHYYYGPRYHHRRHWYYRHYW